MGKRILAFALACLAAAAFVGPASAAGQCESSCDKAFQQCNGSNPDTSACLPKWGQCKRACNPPKATTPAKTTAPVAAPAKVTKVASTTPKKN